MSASDDGEAKTLPYLNVGHVFERARMLALTGQWLAVSKELRAGLQLNASGPDKGRMYALRARAEYRLGHIETAKHHAEKALDLIPGTPHSHSTEAALAEAVLWEIEWRRRHPNPSAARWAWHLLLRWLHGDQVYRVR